MSGKSALDHAADRQPASTPARSASSSSGSLSTATSPAPFLLDPAEVEALTGARWSGPRGRLMVRGACIDSRLVRAGAIFCCFEGAQVDGHDFAAVAVGSGAALVLASKPVSVPAPVLLCTDVESAMSALAREFRRRHACRHWIGVTGSNGKTTTKELIAAALASLGTIHATRGNYNNQLGLPLSMLATPEDAAAVVLELGASQPGDIAALSAIASPTLGVITGIGPAHLEGLGGLTGVAREKSALFAALPPQAPAFLGLHGLDQACASTGASRESVLAIVAAAAKDRRLHLIGDVDFPVQGEETAEGLRLDTVDGSSLLGLGGRHNLANATLTWAVARACGVAGTAALSGLTQARIPAGRLSERQCGHHRIIDDSYNANPASMSAGLAVLARQPGARLAVLGGMGELGVTSVDLHRRVGAEVARHGLPLLTVGERAVPIAEGFREAGGRDYEHAADHAAAIALLQQRLAIGPHTVLVKASRSVGLDAVVAGLLAAEAGQGGRPC